MFNYTSPPTSPPLSNLPSSQSMTALTKQPQTSRRRSLLPTTGNDALNSRSESPTSSTLSSSSVSSFCTSSSTSSTSSVSSVIPSTSFKRRPLRDLLFDRAATLFPSIIILAFGLLVGLHLITQPVLDSFSARTGSQFPLPSYSSSSSFVQTETTIPMQYTSTNYFLNDYKNNFWRSKDKSTRLSNSKLIAELTPWRDSSYARERLRVYYYELPEEFNIGLVKESHANPPRIRDPYCDESFYSAEHTLAQHFRTSPIRTHNASEADFFYVPVYTTCYLMTHLPNDVNRTGAFFEKAMRHVIDDYPYWNASDGRDHVFMFAQGFGARLAGQWQKYRHATFLVHNGDYAEDHFSPAKDVVVPPDLRHYLTPVGLSHPKELLSKHHFVLFGGQVLNSSISDHRGSNYSGGVRQYVSSELANVDGYRITGVRSERYTEDMRRSVFCLAPHGWHKWSPRPSYAILLGCIPIIVSEEQYMFLENLIDYGQISYWIRPSQIKELDGKLRKITPVELVQKERALREVWRLFWYGEEGLAREAVMYSLYRKINGVKRERNYL